MATVNIEARVLAWGIGNEWENNRKAAYALARFIKKIWLEDLEDFVPNDFSIKFRIFSAKKDPPIKSITISISKEWKNYLNAESILKNITKKNDILVMFRNSKEARKFIKHKSTSPLH